MASTRNSSAKPVKMDVSNPLGHSKGAAKSSRRCMKKEKLAGSRITKSLQSKEGGKNQEKASKLAPKVGTKKKGGNQAKTTVSQNIPSLEREIVIRSRVISTPGVLRSGDAAAGPEPSIGWAFRVNDRQALAVYKISPVLNAHMFHKQQPFAVERQMLVNELAMLTSKELLGEVATRLTLLPRHQSAILDHVMITEADFLPNGNLDITVASEQENRLTKLSKETLMLPSRHPYSRKDEEPYDILVKRINTTHWKLQTRLDKARIIETLLEQNRVRLPGLRDHPFEIMK